MAAGIRLADKRDIPALTKIWKACFPDSEEYINYFYSKNFGRIKVPVYTVDNTPVSMVHLIDAAFIDGESAQDAKFIYATGTLPEYRKNGCMGALLRYVTETANENNLALFLKPSTSELVRYYEKFGFVPGAYFRLIDVTPTKKSSVEFYDLSYSEYNKMRDAAFSGTPHISWQDGHIKWCVAENEYFGGRTLGLTLDENEHFIMGYPEDDTLIISETSLSASQLERVSGNLCELFGTSRMRAYMPDSCGVGERILSSVVYNTPLRTTYVNQILI